MVTKPDFSKERKEYQEVEAILRRRALLSLLAMALQSSLVANFNFPIYLKIFFIIMYIVQGLVLGLCVFLSWYQKYKLKRLTQGRELWYFWARTGEGIKYFFIARTRKARAERRAHDKTYELFSRYSIDKCISVVAYYTYCLCMEFDLSGLENDGTESRTFGFQESKPTSNG